MISIEKAIEYANASSNNVIERRELFRLVQFMTVEQIKECGFEFKTKEAEQNHSPEEFTEEFVMQQLKNDVAFGFEKALNQRGISSSVMFETVRFWNKVLENELADFSEDNYAQYGLPLFKATAVLYGFDNPIGDDNGDEDHYSAEYWTDPSEQIH